MYNHVLSIVMYPYVFEISTPYQLTKSKQKRFASRMLKLDLETGLTLSSKLNSLFSTFKSTFQAKSIYTNTFPNIFKKYCSDFFI